MSIAKPKSKYLFSTTSTLLEPTAVGRTTDPNEKFQDYVKDVDDDDSNSDLLSHSDMSWGSMEDRYIPHEIPSDDSISAASSSATSNSSNSSHDRKLEVEDEGERQFFLESGWGSYGLDMKLWDDIRSPVIKMRHLKEMLFEDMEFCGFFTDRLIAVGSSFLAKSPENGLYVFSKCVMRNMSLINITMLHYHRHLQYIDLAYNYLSNLSPLSAIPYLMYLNVSHNRMKHILNFTPPWYLTYVNLSYNYISKMSDISSFWSIVRLDLSHNAIEVIYGLQNLKYLQYLNLSYNLIECIENLDKLPIQELNLEGNCITSFKSGIPGFGINSLPNLHIILLGYNKLSTLEFFKDAYNLRIIDLKFNRINDLLEVSNIKGLIHEIDLTGNPCTKWPNYRGVLLFSIPSIRLIDGSEVSTTEKVSAATLFASPLKLIAARTVTKLTLMEQLSLPRIDLHINTYDEISPPLIILTGPSAVKKIALAMQVSEILPKRVTYCQWYTTKEIENSEAEQQSYIFAAREEFNDMTRRGDFLAIQELLGHSYGFHQDQIRALVSEKKIGITQMDLHAAIQMKRRYSNVKPILILTKSEELHRNWIQEKFNIYTCMKDSVENLLAVKIGKQPDENISETFDSKLNFIEQLIGEIVDSLELPSYSMFVRPQGTGATTTDIILESKTLLPKVVVTRSQAEIEEKKHIKFQEGQIADLETETTLSEQKPKFKGLRVLLDEDSNIIIEDEKSKRKKQRARLLYRRGTLEGRVDFFSTEELGESVSSEETLFDPQPKAFDDVKRPEYLKNMYTEVVIKSRNIYLEHHMNNPGFFSSVVLTDDYSKAFNTLINFVYELYVSHSFEKPILLPEIKHFEQEAIPATVRTIVDEIRESSSTSMLKRKTLLRTYGVTSWKNLMPSQMFQDLNNATVKKELNSV